MIKINIVTGRYIDLPLHYWLLDIGICLVIVSWLLVISSPSYASAEEVTRIIAKVDNQVITSKDLNDYCAIFELKLSGQSQAITCADQSFKKEALSRLIEDRLILAEAKKEAIEISPVLINSQLKQIMLSHSSQEDFENSLLERSLNVTLLKEKIKDQNLMREIIRRKVNPLVSISLPQVSRYYSQNPDKMYSNLGYVFYLARSPDPDFLKQVAQLIKTEGIVKAETAYRGSLTKIESSEKELREELLKILKNLKKGELEIKKIDSGYVLLYLDKLITPHLFSLEEAKEQIYAYLWEAEFQKRFVEWVRSLKQKAVINNYYE